jgi:hypothetical protein
MTTEKTINGGPENVPPASQPLKRLWDATRLSTFMACPERFRLSHVEGWTPQGVKTDLEFGSLVGDGLEVLVKEIVSGADPDAALKAALSRVLALSWNDEADAPRLGRYLDVWRCTGTEKFRNAAGRVAKCPFSHKGKLFPAPGPAVCSCGSPTEEKSEWFAENPVKDRMQALRVVYLYSEMLKSGALRPVSITGPDGKHHALVEHHWQTRFTKDDWLCGNLDSVKAMGDGEMAEVFLSDYKTTKNALTDRYFSQYDPNVQVNLYDLVADRLLPPGVHYTGVAIEAFQVVNGGVNYSVRTFRASPARKAEFIKELLIWLSMAEQMAATGLWVRNRTSCTFCAFKEVCRADPLHRPMILRDHFSRMRWNPELRRLESSEPAARPSVALSNDEITPKFETTPRGPSDAVH